LRFTRLDALLLLMTIIWGTNYSVIKSAFEEVDPQAFNAVRLIVASAVNARDDGDHPADAMESGARLPHVGAGHAA
jgi:drug/metabolite transporter (DMT)-like permease